MSDPGSHAHPAAELTRAEQALRESEERYRAFIEQSSEGIWRCELEEPVPIDLPVEEQIDLFYERAVLAECNLAMARMYGLPSERGAPGRPPRPAPPAGGRAQHQVPAAPSSSPATG